MTSTRRDKVSRSRRSNCIDATLEQPSVVVSTHSGARHRNVPWVQSQPWEAGKGNSLVIPGGTFRTENLVSKPSPSLCASRDESEHVAFSPANQNIPSVSWTRGDRSFFGFVRSSQTRIFEQISWKEAPTARYAISFYPVCNAPTCGFRRRLRTCKATERIRPSLR